MLYAKEHKARFQIQSPDITHVIMCFAFLGQITAWSRYHHRFNPGEWETERRGHSYCGWN